MIAYLYLAIGIIGEVCATAALKATEEFTKPIPSLICVIGYATGLFFLSLTLRSIPVGIAYAIWAGVGVLLVVVISWLFFTESLTLVQIAGMVLVIGGVTMLELGAQH